MNEDILKGKWNQLKGEIQKEWGKITDSEIDMIKGERTRLKGVVQEKYGQTADEAHLKVEEFLARFKDDEEA